MKVAFLGPMGTFSHIAAEKAFPNAKLIPLEGFSDVFDAVEKGSADVGVLPIENSQEGSVNATLDLLLQGRLLICGEEKIPVVHNLLVKPGVKISGVQVVYAHPQAFAQCRKYLEKSLHRAERKEASSNAKACLLLDEKSAAIASDLAAKLYKLETLAKSIQDSSDNFTRFVFISRKDSEKPSGKDKTSIVFSVPDRPGSLLRALQIFGDRHINLTKIESRPSKLKNWEYVFFVDLEGHRLDGKSSEALKALEEVAASIKILGSYPQAK